MLIFPFFIHLLSCSYFLFLCQCFVYWKRLVVASRLWEESYLKWVNLNLFKGSFNLVRLWVWLVGRTCRCDVHYNISILASPYHTAALDVLTIWNAVAWLSSTFSSWVMNSLLLCLSLHDSQFLCPFMYVCPFIYYLPLSTFVVLCSPISLATIVVVSLIALYWEWWHFTNSHPTLYVMVFTFLLWRCFTHSDMTHSVCVTFSVVYVYCLFLFVCFFFTMLKLSIILLPVPEVINSGRYSTSAPLSWRTVSGH